MREEIKDKTEYIFGQRQPKKGRGWYEKENKKGFLK